jgi:hypothetical protein
MISVKTLRTAKEAMSWLNSVFVDMGGPMTKGMYRGLYEVCDEIKRHFVHGTSIGRRTWAPAEARGRKSNLDHFIRPMRVTVGPGGVRGGIEMRGLPALVEAGGRTKPHAIFPHDSRSTLSRQLSMAQLARWTVRRGRRTIVGGGVLRMADGSFCRWVKAHTANIPAHHFAAQIIARHQGLIAEAIERRLARDLGSAA